MRNIYDFRANDDLFFERFSPDIVFKIIHCILSVHSWYHYYCLGIVIILLMVSNIMTFVVVYFFFSFIHIFIDMIIVIWWLCNELASVTQVIICSWYTEGFKLFGLNINVFIIKICPRWCVNKDNIVFNSSCLFCWGQ